MHSNIAGQLPSVMKSESPTEASGKSLPKMNENIPIIIYIFQIYNIKNKIQYSILNKMQIINTINNDKTFVASFTTAKQSDGDLINTVGLLRNPNEFEMHSMNIIKTHALQNKNDISKTHHEYANDFSPIIKNAYNNIRFGKIIFTIYEQYPQCNVLSIDGMDELYVASIGAGGSDRVFETSHLDGPFWFLPFCTVFRCILAVQGNSSIHTDFPCENISHVLQSNEFITIDYNRDIHFIWKDDNVSDDTQRIVLKLHYIVCPRFLPKPIMYVYKGLHVLYNDTMRYLFLNSQGEQTPLSLIINKGTVFYCFLFRHAHVDTLISITFLVFFINKIIAIFL